MDSPFPVNNQPPIKEIALSVSLLVFGMIGIVVGAFMASNRVGGDRAHGTSFRLPFVFVLDFALIRTKIYGSFSKIFRGVLLVVGSSLVYSRVLLHADCLLCLQGLQGLLLFQHSPCLNAPSS